MTLRSAAGPRNVRIVAGMRNWGVFTGTSGLQAKTELEFNGLMPGNAFKWVNTEPTQGNFAFGEADDFVAWADARNMPTRLHVLVWHTSLAAWVAGAVNSGTWDDIINNHIDGVLSHYPSRAWDVEVCNEVFDVAETDGYRDTLWYQAAGGPDYIPWAFERARVHGGANAKLFLAEFGIEQADGQAKRDLLLAAVDDWLSQDVPIDGISLQSHLQCDEALDRVGLRRFIKDLQGMGLEVAVTEFDFRDIASLGMSDANAFTFIGQYTREFLRLVLGAGVKTIVAWGVAPEDWAATGSEQIAAVPFGASPGFAATSIASAMTASFPPDPITARTKELRTVLEIEALDF